MNRQFWLYLAYAGWLVIVILSLLPGHDRPHTGYSGISEHFAAYALVAASFVFAGLSRVTLTKFVAAMTIVSGLLEIAQLWIPGRNSEVQGAVSACLGVICGMIVASLLSKLIVRN